MMHSALDYLDEVTLPENRGRTRAGNTKWIGKLCPMEETLIYGELVYSGLSDIACGHETHSNAPLFFISAYVTPTNVKMMAMVEDPPNPLHAARESDLRALFVSKGIFVSFAKADVLVSHKSSDQVARYVCPIHNESIHKTTGTDCQ